VNPEHFACYRECQGAADALGVKLWEEHFMRENHLLAMALCNRYKHGLSTVIPMDDAEQAACIGVLRALRKYDPEMGTFSNLAGWWVRHELQVVAANGDKLMDGLKGRKYRKAFRKIDAYLARLGTYGTPAEMDVTRLEVEAHQSEYTYFAVSDAITVEPEPIADELIETREDAIEAVDAAPVEPQIPVWALAQRPAYQRLKANLSQDECRLLDDLEFSGDTLTKIAKRNHKSRECVTLLWQRIETEVRGAWQEEKRP
jgi:DNA-directed RNA polymerase specialized sigma subunit